MSTSGTVIGINGNMVSVRADGDVIMNEVGYILVDDKRLKSRSDPNPGRRRTDAGI
jgi:hypothetical protein